MRRRGEDEKSKQNFFYLTNHLKKRYRTGNRGAPRGLRLKAEVQSFVGAVSAVAKAAKGLKEEMRNFKGVEEVLF